MTERTGLALRRALFEALGWTFQPWLNTDGDNVMRLFDPDMKLVKWAYLIGEKTFFNKSGISTAAIDLRESLPPVETSADVSEELLERVCKERGYKWDVYKTHTAYRYSCAIYDVNKNSAHVFGATPSEARAQAILEILRGEQTCGL